MTTTWSKVSPGSKARYQNNRNKKKRANKAAKEAEENFEKHRQKLYKKKHHLKKTRPSNDPEVIEIESQIAALNANRYSFIETEKNAILAKQNMNTSHEEDDNAEPKPVETPAFLSQRPVGMTSTTRPAMTPGRVRLSPGTQQNVLKVFEKRNTLRGKALDVLNATARGALAVNQEVEEEGRRTMDLLTLGVPIEYL